MGRVHIFAFLRRIFSISGVWKVKKKEKINILGRDDDKADKFYPNK